MSTTQPPLKTSTGMSCPSCCAAPGMLHLTDCAQIHHVISSDRALTTMGKLIAGYRPGDDGWTLGDSAAYQAALARRAEPSLSYFHESGASFPNEEGNRRFAPVASAARPEHPDDIAVDNFADAMRDKMARARAAGRSGWENPQECSVRLLRTLLVKAVAKGDPVDVGNFAMMLYSRGYLTIDSSASVGDLPALPNPWGTMYANDQNKEQDGFTADQMRGYAIDARIAALSDAEQAAIKNGAELLDLSGHHECPDAARKLRQIIARIGDKGGDVSDRKLLELAAKAAGYEVAGIAEDGGLLLRGVQASWWPLEDDGDALRLAVKLRIMVATMDGDPNNGMPAFTAAYRYIGPERADQLHADDEFAATRRAIVMVAAEIGKSISVKGPDKCIHQAVRPEGETP